MENDVAWDYGSTMTNLQSFQDSDINIEDGLSRPDDADVFLSASMAFLHQQLVKKMETDICRQKPRLQIAKKYSDLLIFESCSEKDSKIYVKLKNVGKFDEVMKSEASVPQKKLSIHQILPKAKEPRNSSNRTSLMQMFGKKSTGSLSRHSFSLFNLFRKSTKLINDCGTVVEENPFEIPFDSSKKELIEKYLRSIPSVQPKDSQFFSTSSILSENSFEPQSKIKISSLPIYLKINNNNSETRNANNCGYFSTASNLPRPKKYLSKAEEEILKMIPCNRLNPVQISRSENFAPTITEDDCNICEECLKSCPCTSSTTKISLRKQKIQTEQSKLSVCLEDDYVSECDVTGNVSYNFTDEIKSSLTPDVLKVIIRQMVKDFQPKSN